VLEGIIAVQGDITLLQVDGIVNAANRSLLGGGGVDGAIHRAAGPRLLEECRSLRGCATGEAKVTGGYGLAARWVIHTVGPVWRGGGHAEDELLARCYRSCFTLAERHAMRSIGFPAISTGAYGFPLERATLIALTETKDFLRTSESVKEVSFVCFTAQAYRCYLTTMEEVAEPR
jgi:O-acetyl-ADP-ribose deacetylase (regulator of RNase III)